MPDLTATTDNPNGNVLRKLSIIADSLFDLILFRRGLVSPQEIQAFGLSIFCVAPEQSLHQHDAASVPPIVLRLHQSPRAQLISQSPPSYLAGCDARGATACPTLSRIHLPNMQWRDSLLTGRPFYRPALTSATLEHITKEAFPRRGNT